MKISHLKIALIATALLMTSTNTTSAELTWTGCGVSKKAFMKELAAAYEKKSGVKVLIKDSGATAGIRNTATGEANLGGSCRHTLNVSEEQGVKLHQVAWDALVFIVKEDNPVSSITLQQGKDIVLGKITNWKEIGGPDKPINFYARKGKISGVELMAREILFKNAEIDFAKTMFEKPSTGQIESAVADDIAGVGMSGYSSASRREGIRMLKIAGVPASKQTIANGSYGLHRPLYLVSKGEPAGEIKKFIEFAMSDEGQTVIAAQGTVNLKEGGKLAMK